MHSQLVLPSLHSVLDVSWEFLPAEEVQGIICIVSQEGIINIHSHFVSTLGGAWRNPFECPDGGLTSRCDACELFVLALTVSNSCWSLRTVTRRMSKLVSSRLPVAVLEVSDLMGLITTDWTVDSTLDQMDLFESSCNSAFPSGSAIAVE